MLREDRAGLSPARKSRRAAADDRSHEQFPPDLWPKLGGLGPARHHR